MGFDIGICVSSCGGPGCGAFSRTLCERCVYATLAANGLPTDYADHIRNLDHRGIGNIYGHSEVHWELERIINHLQAMWELSEKAVV